MRRAPGEEWLTVRGARHNNLKNIDFHMPLGAFVCVTGVSGSGKSSLVNDILVQALRRDLNRGEGDPGEHDGIEGLRFLDKLIAIDQSPIGRTPRSNPGTYIKVFDDIRSLFAQMPESKQRGYKPGRFSFNVDGGRCQACDGNGSTRLEMDFLADVWVTCPVCEGHRFNRETLGVRFKDKSISDVLEMDVQQALDLFDNIPQIRHKLQTLHDVGLDYLKIGQPSPTLSGGEAQRIKLARELVKKSTGQTLYLLDEPTTGLHFADIKMLLQGAAWICRSGKYRTGRRTQPGRRENGRLGHRPRTGRRCRGRPDHRRRDTRKQSPPVRIRIPAARWLRCWVSNTRGRRRKQMAPRTAARAARSAACP